MLGDVKPNDLVLIHAGMAISRLGDGPLARRAESGAEEVTG